MNDQRQNRGFILFAAAIVMLIMGFCYMYSIIHPFVMSHFSIDAASASMPYSIFLAFFVVGNIAGGKLQQKFSVRVATSAGAALLVSGTLLTAFLPPSAPELMWLTYGALLGAGDGIFYNVAVAIAQKWFVDKKGVAIGILLAALGVSGVIFSPLCASLLNNFGFSTTFLVLAAIFAAVSVWGVATLRSPPEGYMADFTPKDGASAGAVRQFSTGEMVKTREFYLIAVSFMLAIPAFVLISAIFVTLGGERGLTQQIAVTGVMLASLSQVVGRLLIAMVSDKIGRRAALTICFIATIAAVLLLVVATGYLYVVCFMCLSFAYGGAAATYPSITTDYFGVKNAGVNYGVVMIGFGVSSVLCPILARALAGTEFGFSLSFIVAGCAAAVSAVLVFLLRKKETMA